MWSAPPFPPVYDSEMLPATVVVTITKPTSSAPVGLNLVNGSDAISPPVLEEVRGLALACGLLQPGDLLLSVNEVEVTDHRAAAALIRAAPDRLVLRLRRPPPRLMQPSALHHAARAADLAGMARALDLREVGNVDVTDESGWSALHAASQGTSAEAVRLLLDRGADVHARTDIQATPLHPNPNPYLPLSPSPNPNPNQATPLHIAAFNGRLEVVKLLCMRGANPHAKDKDGYTPLDDARYRSADRCCAVETPQKQWIRVAAFLDKVAPMTAEVTHTHTHALAHAHTQAHAQAHALALAQSTPSP